MIDRALCARYTSQVLSSSISLKTHNKIILVIPRKLGPGEGQSLGQICLVIKQWSQDSHPAVLASNHYSSRSF